MPDNPTEVESPAPALPGYRVLALAGRDALAFAQAQMMNDVTALGDGQWQWNGWLTPKGRVTALFALLRLDTQTLWLLLPDHAPSDLADALHKFVFRSKVALMPRADLQVAGTWDAAWVADAHALQLVGDDAVSLAWPGTRRIDIRLPGAAQTTTPHADDAARWREADLTCGIPRLGAAQSAQWTPQQLSLQRLQAFSVKKGCYPGQEIVARTHFLGQAKRGLVLLHTDGSARAGDDITNDGHVIGQVIASAGNIAHAVLPLEAGDAPLMVGDAIVTRHQFAPL